MVVYNYIYFTVNRESGLFQPYACEFEEWDVDQSVPTLFPDNRLRRNSQLPKMRIGKGFFTDGRLGRGWGLGTFSP